MEVLVGIIGKKQVGKNTFAEAMSATLVGEHALRAECLAFADPIKKMGAVLGLSSAEETKEVKDPLLHISPRQAWQTIGKAMRDLQPLLWVKVMERTIEQIKNQTDVVIITDIRHDEEAFMVKRYGGILVQVYRPYLANDDAHASEKGLSPEAMRVVDKTVINTDLSDFKQEAQVFAMEIKNQKIGKGQYEKTSN